MDKKELREYLPEGQTHLIGKMEKRDLARLVDTFLFKLTYCSVENKNMEVLKIETAFQAICQLIKDEDISDIDIIKNEEDWIQYFQLCNQDV